MVELILVLAITVVVAAMAVAQFGRSYSGQYLKKGANRVRAEFNKARVRAMRSGDIHVFLYQPGGNQFAVGKYSELESIALDDARVNRGQFQFFDQFLPADVVFAEGDISWDSQAQFASERFGGSALGDLRPILFYGDGTSQNAKLTLVHISGSSIQVNLRGLTGLASSTNVINAEGRR